MALQIRRGTDADRQGITPKAGEPIFTTDTKKLYIGDGSTAGGIIVDTTAGISNVIEDTSPQLGGNLDLNNKTINGTGSIDITGQISATSIDLKGSIFADDSTLLVDGISGRIVGPVHANVTGDLTGNVTGNVTGSLNGTVDGSLNGSVFGDDSTPLVDGVRNEITGAINTTQTARFNGQIFVDGQTQIGVTTGDPGWTYYSTSTNGLYPVTSMNLSNVHDDAYTNELGLFRARGTIASQTTVQANDVLGTLSFSGYDGTSPEIGASVTAEVTAVSTGNITADVKIKTRAGGVGTFAEAVTFKSDKGTVAASYVQFGSLTTVERDALTAANGMVIYNETTNKFQGYENGAWVDLV